MTLRYVFCGRAIGARTAAVATDQHDLWELEAAALAQAAAPAIAGALRGAARASARA